MENTIKEKSVVSEELEIKEDKTMENTISEGKPTFKVLLVDDTHNFVKKARESEKEVMQIKFDEFMETYVVDELTPKNVELSLQKLFEDLRTSNFPGIDFIVGGDQQRQFLRFFKKAKPEILKNTIFSTESHPTQKLDLKLHIDQLEQLVWMALLGIRTSNWCLDLISCYNKENIYWEEIAQTELNIQSVKEIIKDEMAKLMSISLEYMVPSGIDKEVLAIIDKLVFNECKKITEESSGLAQ